MMGSGCIKNCQSLKMNATIKYKKRKRKFELWR